MRKLIIKLSALISVVLFLIGACSLDSEPMVLPLILMGITGGWLCLLAFANGLFK